MSSADDPTRGKFVEEDLGITGGRTRDWPGVPRTLMVGLPAWCSTSTWCALCGNLGGLTYDTTLGEFRCREGCHHGTVSLR